MIEPQWEGGDFGKRQVRIEIEGVKQGGNKSGIGERSEQ